MIALLWALSLVEYNEIIIAFFASIPASIAAWAALVAAKNSREANDSVNHRHERGGMKVYDLAAESYRLAVHNSRMIEALVQMFRDQGVDGPLDSIPKEPPSQSILLEKDPEKREERRTRPKNFNGR